MSDPKKPEVTKPETAKLDPTVAEAMRLVAEQMIPAAVAAAVAATQGSRQSAPQAQASPAPARHEKCHDCGQVRTGCEGRHVDIVVFPTRYPHHAEYFSGVQINGVRYLSNDASHRVCVPANCESSILNIVSAFEQNEQDQAMGRKASHHGGRVGPNGSQTKPANAAWR